MLLFAAGATNRRASTGLSRTVKLKGYRTGHVPRRMVERYFGEDLKKNVAQELVTGSIHEPLGEHKLDPVAPPCVENGEVKMGEPFKYTATVEVRPNVDPKDYEGLAAPKTDVEITDAQVEEGGDAEEPVHRGGHLLLAQLLVERALSDGSGRSSSRNFPEAVRPFPGRRKRRAGPTRKSDRRKGLNPRRPLRTMLAMRRSLAAIALSATLGYAVAPALAAACCPAAAPHACCTKTGNDATATRAPCCKRSPETATPRTEATPGSATRVAAPLAGALEHAPALATSSALAAPVRNLARPRSHALGPPLRLRI